MASVLPAQLRSCWTRSGCRFPKLPARIERQELEERSSRSRTASRVRTPALIATVRRLIADSIWSLADFYNNSRMSRSKTSVVTYDPRLSNLTMMSLFHPLPPPNTLPHQLRPPSLLSASLAHGLAARSDVTNGKVSKGYLDPWGTTDHTSLWQPPAHASPPTVLALASKRETPTIVWGFAEGGVGCTLVAGYATGNGKTSAKTFHAVAGEGHEGPVVALSGAKDGAIVLSGGADGRVILWGVPPPSAGRVQSTLQRLWSGRATEDERSARETVRCVCWDERAGGTVASITDSGVLTVWTGVTGAEEKLSNGGRRAMWVDEELRATIVVDRNRTITLSLDVDDIPATPNLSAAVTIRVLLHATPSNTFKRLVISFPDNSAELPHVTPTAFEPPSADAAELTCFHVECTIPLPPGLPFQHSISLGPTPALSRIPSSDAVNATEPIAPEVAIPAVVDDERQVLHLPMSTSIERRALGLVGQGKFVVTGDGDGVVRLWNWDDGGLVQQWRAIDGKVTALECTMGLVLVGRCVTKFAWPSGQPLTSDRPQIFSTVWKACSRSTILSSARRRSCVRLTTARLPVICGPILQRAPLIRPSGGCRKSCLSARCSSHASEARSSAGGWGPVDASVRVGASGRARLSTRRPAPRAGLACGRPTARADIVCLILLSRSVLTEADCWRSPVRPFRSPIRASIGDLVGPPSP